MEQVKVYYDALANSLTVWFGDPASEYIAVEAGDDINLMKDPSGKVIGFEKLNFTEQPGDVTVKFETWMGVQL